jgi:hypothetical protein
MGSIFGGSKQKASASNQAYPYLQQTFSPVAAQTTGAANSMQALLGGDATGFNKYKAATGFDANTEYGSRGITGNAAANGLLRSGSTAKALQGYGDMMQNQYAGNYLQQLLGLGQLGIGAGGVIGGAGNVSNSSSKSKNGMGGFLGSALGSFAASDRRLKKDIKYLRTRDDGLNVYQFKYINDRGPYIGVMSDEVRALKPEALGPIIDGYDTVDYGKIGVL